MNYLSKLRVKSFGPIRSDNNIEINKLTIFIGDQGTGKSTLAKLISTFFWIEKSLVRGNINESWLKQRSFKDTFLSYHRLENYLSSDSILEYEGMAYSLRVEENRILVEKKDDYLYNLPQIMYVPAERNFISYVRSANELKISSEALQEFLTEFNNSKNSITINNREMPFGNIYLDYDKLNDLVNLVGDTYKVKLSESSSGLQSATPLYLVSQYLAYSIQNSEGQRMNEIERNKFMKEIRSLLNNELTEEQKRLALSAITKKFNRTAFVNIVEEPEQNLFPESQWKMMKKLIELNNLNDNNKLIVTTHSPYIISQLGIAIQLNELKSKLSLDDFGDYHSLLNDISIDSDLLSIYQLDSVGNASLLEKEYGIPSDNNYLNDWLKKQNNMFDFLLEKEQEI